MSKAIKNHQVLLDTNLAGDGAWFQLDYMAETGHVRPIQGKVVTGDTIKIQATTVQDESSITADDIVDLKQYTADFNDVINGAWAFIRVSKVGTTGNAKVQGTI